MTSYIAFRELYIYIFGHFNFGTLYIQKGKFLKILIFLEIDIRWNPSEYIYTFTGIYVEVKKAKMQNKNKFSNGFTGF